MSKQGFQYSSHGCWWCNLIGIITQYQNITGLCARHRVPDVYLCLTPPRLPRIRVPKSEIRYTAAVYRDTSLEFIYYLSIYQSIYLSIYLSPRHIVTFESCIWYWNIELYTHWKKLTDILTNLSGLLTRDARRRYTWTELLIWGSGMVKTVCWRKVIHQVRRAKGHHWSFS